MRIQRTRGDKGRKDCEDCGGKKEVTRFKGVMSCWVCDNEDKEGLWCQRCRFFECRECMHMQDSKEIKVESQRGKNKKWERKRASGHRGAK